MLEQMQKEKAKRNPNAPKYRGPPPPPNRFNIGPGYRWDGTVKRVRHNSSPRGHPSHHEPAHVLGALLWAREESLHRVGAEGRLRRHSGSCAKVASFTAFHRPGGTGSTARMPTRGSSSWRRPRRAWKRASPTSGPPRTCELDGSSMGARWELNGSSMGAQWELHGSSMGAQWHLGLSRHRGHMRAQWDLGTARLALLLYFTSGTCAQPTWHSLEAQLLHRST